MKKNKYYIITCILCLLFIITNIFYQDIYDNLKNKIIKIQEILIPKITIDNKYIVNMINKEYEQELIELNKLLNINLNTNYKYINSKVISSINLYENILTINKGNKDGIKKGMPAVSSTNLIGTVDTVFEDYSYVKLLIDKKLSVSVINNDLEYNGNITKYNIANNELFITLIRSNCKINKGDMVITNGISKYIPKGIKIGIVNKIIIDKETNIKSVKVKLDNNISNIKYIGIIKGVKND